MRALASFCLLCLLFWIPACRKAIPPECVRLDEAARGIERIVEQDWRSMEPAGLEKVWPGLRLFPSTPEGVPLAALAEQIGQLCETCDAHGGASMDAGDRGLHRIELWICQRPLPEVRSALRGLARAAVGAQRAADSIHETEQRVIEGYSWTSEGQSFTLRADAIRTDAGWVGNYSLGRCGLEEFQATWPAGVRGNVRIKSVEIDRKADVALVFDYLTTCLVEDSSCWGAELDGLWPRLRALAEREQVTRIAVTPEDCAGRSVSFRLERSAEGVWKGLWTPKSEG